MSGRGVLRDSGVGVYGGGIAGTAGSIDATGPAETAEAAGVTSVAGVAGAASLREGGERVLERLMRFMCRVWLSGEKFGVEILFGSGVLSKAPA